MRFIVGIFFGRWWEGEDETCKSSGDEAVHALELRLLTAEGDIQRGDVQDADAFFDECFRDKQPDVKVTEAALGMRRGRATPRIIFGNNSSGRPV